MIIDVSTVLAEAATHDAQARISALGMGWSVTGPSPLPAFVLMVNVRTTPDHGGRLVRIGIKLISSTGEGVFIGFGPNPFDVVLEQAPMAQSDRPEGLEGGVSLTMQVPAGAHMDPGGYEFVISVDDETRPHWTRPFHVRSKPNEFDVIPKVSLRSGDDDS